MTDIDQFYPSIYTHAIPWSLHTKAVCKAALKAGKKKSPPLIGDLLDRALQTMNDGETHGIPIGPDTSLVIAEIVLASVDAELLKRFGTDLRGFRYVDDYELSFGSLSATEQALADLQGVLATFELLLNPKKTEIVELPHRLDSGWSTELKSAEVRGAKQPVGQRNDLLALFSRAFDLASDHPSDSVLRYAVSRVQGVSVASSAWRAFHNCVLGAAAADASTLPVALGTLFEVAQRGTHAVPQAPLGEVFESIVARHAPRSQASEVAWAIWGALAWNVSLSAQAARLVSSMEDDVVALLALHANARHLFPAGALDLAVWSSLVNQPDALNGEHWLLAYEANQQGWLNVPAVSASPVFSAFSKGGVRFYDRTKIKPQFPQAGRAVPGGRLWSDYA
ncbi:MAG: RNA-directed DNA polymerase [Acidobacteriota bacterium]|nr:RNA-directed DNA polymerase [Acidobacteriota bacterium]